MPEVSAQIRVVSRHIERLARCVPVAALLATWQAAGCSHTPWPDEPGIPVELERMANVDAGDTFFAALVNQRRAARLAEPVVAPGYQGEIRAFADDLQAGKTSIAAAERAVETWGRAAYKREVRTFVLDCSPGSAMRFPDFFVQAPVVVIAYAAAHFRPRSLPKTQCAILAVAIVGSERVAETKL